MQSRRGQWGCTAPCFSGEPPLPTAHWRPSKTARRALSLCLSILSNWRKNQNGAVRSDCALRTCGHTEADAADRATMLVAIINSVNRSQRIETSTSSREEQSWWWNHRWRGPICEMLSNQILASECARVSCSTGKFGLVQSNGEQGEQTDSQTDQLSSRQTIHMAINNAVMPIFGITIKWKEISTKLQQTWVWAWRKKQSESELELGLLLHTTNCQ